MITPNSIYKRVKKYIFRTISFSDRRFLPNRIFVFFLSLLILINIAIVFLASYQDIHEQYGFLFYSIEMFSIVAFTLEYWFRVWTADLQYAKISAWQARLRFVVSPMGIVDLFAVVPFYLPFIVYDSGETHLEFIFIRSFRMLSLLRFMTFSKHGVSARMLAEVVRELKFELAGSFFITFIYLVISATAMYMLEHKAQPTVFENIGDAFWWAVITLSTVGYGDIYPITPLGKILGGITAIIGGPIFVVPAILISAAFVQRLHQHRMKERESAAKMETRYRSVCPHCGEKI